MKNCENRKENLLETTNSFKNLQAVCIPVKWRDKRPIHSGWQDTSIDDIDYERDFSSPSNVGVLLGEKSGNLVDIDIDCDEALRVAERFLPETGIVWGRAGRPASHWVYKVPDCGKTAKFSEPGGEGMLVEYRSTGCQSVIPPSVHPSGENVLFEKEFGAPTELSRTQLLESVSQLAACALLAKHWASGDRHDLALALAGTLLSSGWNKQGAIEFVESVCIAARDDDVEDRVRAVSDTVARLADGKSAAGRGHLIKQLGSKVVRKVEEWLEIAQSPALSLVSGTGPQANGTLASIPYAQRQTDVGNACRFVDQHGDDVRYCSEIEWLVWNGEYWEQSRNRALSKTRETATSIFHEFEPYDGSKEFKGYLSFAKRSSQFGSLTNMLKIAKIDLKIGADELDRDGFLLNLKNGTLDLRTGQLRNHCRDDLITRQVETEFDPYAECPLFDDFLEVIFQGDQELVGFVQRAAGYTLTGSTAEHCLFMAYGTGANGKTTFLGILEALLGSLAKSLPVDSLVFKKYGSGIPNDLAGLRGARLAIASEGETSHRLAESKVKRMTGGEKLSVRFLHKEFFDYAPQFKLWIATNFKPQVSGEDKAMWRRIHLIPFDYEVPAQDRDGLLPQKLREELPGILNWAVKGCLEWQENGLNPPEAVLFATDEYQKEMDFVQQFLDECVESVQVGTVTKALLYKAYEVWCHENGCQALSMRALTDRLRNLGFEDGRNREGRFWSGKRLVGRAQIRLVSSAT